MKLQELPKPIQEALACHELFRRLGFPSEAFQIIVGTSIFTKLTWGELTFVLDLGESSLPSDKQAEYWKLATHLWQTAPENELQQLWEQSDCKNQAAEIVFRLRQKGIKPPCMAN